MDRITEKWFFFCGPDGVGKTTLIEHVKNHIQGAYATPVKSRSYLRLSNDLVKKSAFNKILRAKVNNTINNVKNDYTLEDALRRETIIQNSIFCNLQDQLEKYEIVLWDRGPLCNHVYNLALYGHSKVKYTKALAQNNDQICRYGKPFIFFSDGAATQLKDRVSFEPFAKRQGEITRSYEIAAHLDGSYTIPPMDLPTKPANDGVIKATEGSKYMDLIKEIASQILERCG